MFFIAVVHVVSLLWQLLSFLRLIMGKNESRPLFLSDFRYFDKSFTVIFLEKSCNNHMN